MKKIIFVNATAATEGGALTILRQFLDSIKIYSNKDCFYYVFCSLLDLKLYENEQIKIINDIKAKKWIDRIKWDLFGLKNWSKKNNIKADLIISFQNTGCRYFKNTKQLIYIHQPLPFYQDKKWNIFKRDERSLWFYQNIYKRIIKYSADKDSIIVVQTETMKEKLINAFRWDSNKIFAIRPSFTNININQVSKIDFNDNKFHIFYPATTYLYKNHEIIIKALKYIKDKKEDIFHHLLVHFTFDNTSQRNLDLIQLMNKLEVNDAIKLEGKLPYDKILSFYKSCDLVVFPSYIESHPLPLIEAALFGLPLLVSDLDFSREIISDYEGVKFLDYRNEKLWAENIIWQYNNKLKYKPYHFNCRTSWKDFFELIDKMIR
ncbi:MAG: glycosyltransferase [Candidatus Pacebacteria bacterium]|nr:glycosyltransferase [Candidatus Paceibacterota bacterium]